MTEEKLKKIGDMKKLFTFFVLTILSHVMMAQEVSVTISVEEPTVRVNDLVGIKIAVSGIRTNLPPVDLTTPNVMKEMQGSSSTSTSMSIINGVTSITSTELRTYIATKTGDYIFGPAKMEYNGKTYTSNKVSVKVISADKKLPKENGNSGIDEYVFLRTIPSTTNLVVGQPVYIKYKLYFRTRISNLRMVQDVSAAGALMEEYDTKTPNTRPIEEVYQGVQYNSIVIKEVLAYPQQSGSLTINPVILNLQAARPKTSSRRSIFDDFLIDPFQEYASVNISSQPLTLNVKSISPTPSDYSGFVGKLKGSNTLSKTEVKINEPVSIKYSFEGTGNFKNFIVPKIQFPSTVESYPPKEESTVRNSVSGGTGKFTVEHIVVPRYSGDINLPPMSVSYYDIEKKSFQTISFKAQKISVIGSAAGNSNLTSQAYDFRTIGRDISFIQTSTNLTKISDDSGTLSYYSVISTSVIWVGLLGLLLYRYKNASDRADVVGYAHKHAEKFAKKALMNAKKLSADQDIKMVLGEVHKVISQFVAHKAKLNETAWTVQELLDVLKTKNIPEEKLNAIETFLKKLNEYRFAPVQLIDMNADAVIADAEKTMADLSTYL